MRYITSYIQRDMQKKMVILSGLRQSGKTYLARQRVARGGQYLNWDVRTDQKTIRDIAWDKDVGMMVLDELHKYLKWKNFLKGVVDEWQNRLALLVTCSARLKEKKGINIVSLARWLDGLSISPDGVRV